MVFSRIDVSVLGHVSSNHILELAEEIIHSTQDSLGTCLRAIGEVWHLRCIYCNNNDSRVGYMSA